MTSPATTLIASIDQSTTSTKFFVFSLTGEIIANVLKPHKQITPQPGWLEHDPMEIIENVNAVIAEGMEQVKAKGFATSSIKCLGVTNQRETVVAWNKNTGKPYYNAVVWSDTRTAGIVERFIKKHGGNENHFKELTGLPIATYFSALKIRWLIENVEEIRNDLANVYFGTADTWTIYNLTKGGSFVTDVTNASRTFLMNITTLKWDESLLKEFEIPLGSLATIKSSAEHLGVVNNGNGLQGVPITGCLGDQQAASIGHGLFRPGDVKNTYGTGCFMLLNMGETLKISKAGLLTTVLFQLGGSRKPVYAFEGSIECGGSSLNWARDNLELFKDFDEMTTLASSVENSGGVYFVPAMSGLFTPYWNGHAKGTIVGLSFHSRRAHVIRALIEGICMRTREVVGVMQSESPVKLNHLKVDGGVSVNKFIMQLQADMIGDKLQKTNVKDSTCLGVALAAGWGAGLFSSEEELTKFTAIEIDIEPDLTKTTEWEKNSSAWKKAVESACNSMNQPSYESTIQQLKVISQLCLLYTSPSPRDGLLSRMPSSA
eukprot:TRINITY_DN9605_c0_g1_i2.p1 TRINITY_DN9605_c0_g1~~TRINITY_DN9605_c0_g1_i2.p1  ORF type:complete len:545 (+),score=138.61 TRINITY_DN9605_c0_g1_i2:96-1730(+)